jgi:hypothetical protein
LAKRETVRGVMKEINKVRVRERERERGRGREMERR